jgi:hypothetical protein
MQTSKPQRSVYRKAQAAAEWRRTNNIWASGGNFEAELTIGLHVRRGLAVRTTGLAGPGTRTQRIVDDGLDGARASAALDAASEAIINLLGVAGQIVRTVNGIADFVVTEDVAGTDNHENGRAFAGTPSSRYTSIDK